MYDSPSHQLGTQNIPSENQLQAVSTQTSSRRYLVHDPHDVREQLSAFVCKYSWNDSGVHLGFLVMEFDKTGCGVATSQRIEAVFYELTFRGLLFHLVRTYTYVCMNITSCLIVFFFFLSLVVYIEGAVFTLSL